MIQGIDNDFLRPNYNAVKINIKHPYIHANGNQNDATTNLVTDNGVYNAVNISIDNPEVNTEPKQKIYDYPQSQSYVPYNMLDVPVTIPEGFAAHYYETNVIVPAKTEAEEVNAKEEEDLVSKEENFTPDVQEQNKASESVVVPSPNFTSVEAEKKNPDIKIGATDTKKPEIIPPEEIKPDVDINVVADNLKSGDYDVQALQMEAIVREILDDNENAIPYIVKDVFNSLVDIINKDTTAMAAPDNKQLEARQKIMANAAAMNNNAEVPYELNDNDIILATTLSPMELAERNKEYAMYTTAVLAKEYADQVEKHTGNVVSITDMPGVSSIVDALRYSQNPSVKTAAIDALMYIQRPEYKNELNTIYSLAQLDPNPMVSTAAKIAIEKTNS